MAEDTGQPLAAPETDPMRAAAEAFKAFDGLDAPSPRDEVEEQRLRDERGRFASKEAEIEAADEGEPEAGAESQDEGQDADEAPDEGQPEVAPLPESWSQENAEIWAQLPPEAQAYIAQRDGEQKALITRVTQETANARKAAEAVQAEAQANRDNALAITEAAIQLIQPQWPSPTMLNINSGDYDPDTYHLQRAQAESQQAYLTQLTGQRQQLIAQAQQDAQRAEQEHAAQINQATLPAFSAAYPEALDQAKAQDFYGGLVKFAIDAGAPEDFFRSGPLTAVEWHIIADAKKWREHQTALKKVKTEQKPAARQAQPAVRPGVTTPRSAVEATKRKASMERLARSGSIQDAAAVFKTF